VVLGRKNWIHVGSEQAGPKVAAILSVVETCRRLKVPVREYLASVLPGLEDVQVNASVSTRLLSGLLPAAENKNRSDYGLAASGIEDAHLVGIRRREAHSLSALPEWRRLPLLRVS
jgi:hypothetical protein